MLKQRRLALADPHAQRRQAIPAAAAPELVHERDDEPRPAHPERVPERDRAAVHVHPRGIEAELTDDDEALRRERLVQLHDVEVGDLDTRAREQLAHRGHRSDAHHARVDPRDRAAGERCERLDAERPSPLLARHDERRCAVVDPGGVPGRHRPALPERRLQPSELLQ